MFSDNQMYMYKNALIIYWSMEFNKQLKEFLCFLKPLVGLG